MTALEQALADFHAAEDACRALDRALDATHHDAEALAEVAAARVLVAEAYAVVEDERAVEAAAAVEIASAEAAEAQRVLRTGFEDTF